MDEVTLEQILLQAFRLGRDLEAHASEQIMDPQNYAQVRRYVDEEMRELKHQLCTAIQQQWAA